MSKYRLCQFCASDSFQLSIQSIYYWLSRIFLLHHQTLVWSWLVKYFWILHIHQHQLMTPHRLLLDYDLILFLPRYWNDMVRVVITLQTFPLTYHATRLIMKISFLILDCGCHRPDVSSVILMNPGDLGIHRVPKKSDSGKANGRYFFPLINCRYYYLITDSNGWLCYYDCSFRRFSCCFPRYAYLPLDLINQPQ